LYNDAATSTDKVVLPTPPLKFMKETTSAILFTPSFCLLR